MLCLFAPTSASLALDSNGNLITDYDELFVYGSDPLTDSDGDEDHTEIAFGSDPLDAVVDEATPAIYDFRLDAAMPALQTLASKGVPPNTTRLSQHARLRPSC